MGKHGVYMEMPGGGVFSTEHPEHHKDCKRLAYAEGERQERAEAIERLRELFPPGSTVPVVLRHVSASGMSRRISVLAVHEGRISDVSWRVSRALDRKLHKDGGIVVGGCGMDMGFALVHDLSSTLYGSGYACLGTGENGRCYCPSNYHSNHRNTLKCEGVINAEGERRYCYRPSAWWSREDIPADWPRRTVKEADDDGPAITVAASCLTAEDGTAPQICPTCEGRGEVPNPEGPERFDLVHVDGYALRHEWI